MFLSAVSVLVVAQSSSEIPEGLMNNSVFDFIDAIYGVSRFEVLTAAVSVKVTVFWNVTSCISVVNLQRFGGSCCLRNFSTCLPDCELEHL